jgi:hypothetical protein
MVAANNLGIEEVQASFLKEAHIERCDQPE